MYQAPHDHHHPLNKVRTEFYTKYFAMTNNFNPSPTFELVYDQYLFVMSLLQTNISDSPTRISTAMEIWTDHLPEIIPRESHFAWRDMIVEFACDQLVAQNRPNPSRFPATNQDLLAATRKIVGSLNLFDQAQLVISLQNKAKFSGQLSQALRNDMLSPETKKDLEQAFATVKSKNGDLYLAKATENKLNADKKKKAKEALPPTLSPSPLRLSSPSPSPSKKIKLE